MQSMMGLAHGTIYWKLIEDMKRGLQPNSPFLWIIQQSNFPLNSALYLPREMFVFSTVSLNHPAPIPLHMFNFDQMHTLHDYYLR